MSGTDREYAPLAALYEAHAALIRNDRFACGPGCSTCCSVNVVVTSLEADHLRRTGLLDDAVLAARVRRAAGEPHYIPSATTNLVAACCLAGRQPPPDPSEHRPGACPLLDGQGLCRAYSHRPFACRSMCSTTPCADGGEAVMEPFLVTLDLALCQLIEHLDRQGWTGNLLDMLLPAADRQGVPRRVRNRPLPGFLVPPGEERRFRAAMEKILAWPVDGRRLGDFLPPLF